MCIVCDIIRLRNVNILFTFIMLKKLNLNKRGNCFSRMIRICIKYQKKKICYKQTVANHSLTLSSGTLAKGKYNKKIHAPNKNTLGHS